MPTVMFEAQVPKWKLQRSSSQAKDYFIILLCYYIIILLYHYIIVFLYYYIIILLYYYIILLLYYYIIIFLYYYNIIIPTEYLRNTYGKNQFLEQKKR